MLLCGSFENQVIRLIHMLRFDEKLLSRAKDSGKEVSLGSDDEYQEDSDSESAAFSGVGDENEDNHVHDGSVKAENIHVGARKDWRRVRKIYSRSKQYVFVAATLPQSGKRTAGGVLKRMFPDAVWVSGTYLHRHNPRYALCFSIASAAFTLEIHRFKLFGYLAQHENRESLTTYVANHCYNLL